MTLRIGGLKSNDIWLFGIYILPIILGGPFWQLELETAGASCRFYPGFSCWVHPSYTLTYTPETYVTWNLKMSFFQVFLPLVFGGVALLWQLYAFGNDSNANSYEWTTRSLEFPKSQCKWPKTSSSPRGFVILHVFFFPQNLFRLKKMLGFKKIHIFPPFFKRKKMSFIGWEATSTDTLGHRLQVMPSSSPTPGGMQ